MFWCGREALTSCSNWKGSLCHMDNNRIMHGIKLFAVNIRARWLASTFCWHMLDLVEDIAKLNFHC